MVTEYNSNYFMNTLHVFGDSYTEDYEKVIKNSYSNIDNNVYQLYKNYRCGNLPYNWSTILGTKLNYSINNHGLGGTGNDDIFEKVCEHSNEFKKGDMIIVGWSFHNRFRWSHYSEHLKTEVWTHILPNSYTNVVSEKTADEIMVNRDSLLYRKQIENFENILINLSESIGFECYFWTFDSFFRFPKNHKNWLEVKGDNLLYGEILKLGGLDIEQETKGEVKDNHFGESGHKIMADIFYKLISEKNM